MLQRGDTVDPVQVVSEGDSVRDVGAILKQVVKIAIMGGILYYLYQKGLLDFSKVKAVLTDPPTVALGFSVIFGSAFFAVARWRLLLEGQGIHLPYWQAFQLTFIGMFFNTALPGAVSGDVVKGYYIVKQQPDGKGKSKAFATLLFDRVLGVSGLIMVAFVAMLCNMTEMLSSAALKTLVTFISLAFAGMVAFYGFVLIEWKAAKRINGLLKKAPGGEILSKLFEAVKCYEDNPLLVLKGFLFSVGIHSLIVFFIIAVARQMGGFEDIATSSFFLLTPLGLLVTAVPIAPAGLGTGHVAFLTLFQLVGSRGGADLFTAFVAFQIVVNLLGGVFYLRAGKQGKKNG